MRIVARVTQQVQVCAGGVNVLGYHIMWCPKYCCPVLAGQTAGRCEELVDAKASEHDWRMVALEIRPDRVPLFVKAHRCDSPFRIVRQFKGFTSRQLRTGFPHLRTRLPTLWCRSYLSAAAGAVPAQTVRRYNGAQDGRPWQKELTQ
jgi:putative transposase